jgi:cardiolipin synthase
MADFVDGNRVTLLRCGVEYFPAITAAFDAAQREIHVETYIFESDGTGRGIAAALMRAARRGVATHLLVDGFGSKGLDRRLVGEMREAGVRFLVYRPDIAAWALRRARLRRLHRKIVVVDGRVAFVGGINILDDFDPPGAASPRFDYAVRVEGPLVGRIRATVKRLWALVNATRLRARLPLSEDFEPPAAFPGGQRAALVVRDNVGHRRDIEQAYLDAIGGARSEILIANAYFFPGIAFRHALIAAAARGVRVLLLLQARVEYALLHHASRALYGPFLDAGIEIHEYGKSFLHAKVAVIDRRWATVGSSNIDPFSLLLAREANVVVDDAAFAQQLRRSLLAAMAAGARPVHRDNWRRQPLPARLAAWCAYGTARLLTGVFAYGGTRELG